MSTGIANTDTPPRAPSPPAFRTDIQGLRALAVVAVVVNHAFPQALTGGFVGVDIFFVISGYLIPKIIAREIEGGTFSIKHFYARRARRILPALLVVLALTLAAGWVALPPDGYRELARTALATALFASNFEFARMTGYFDGAAELKPLLHMWSLAVEEQFYLLLPLFLYLIWRKTARSLTLPLLWLTALATLAMAIAGGRMMPEAGYFLLPTRAIELMIGTLFGIGGIPKATRAPIRHLLSLAGLSMMLVAIFRFTPDTPLLGTGVLLPCIGAALVIHAGDGAESLGGRLLSIRPVPYLGAVSYSFYLWHWPILAFPRNLVGPDLPFALALAAVAGALAMAALSYHFVEQPALSRPPPSQQGRSQQALSAKPGYRPYLKISAAGMALAMAACVAIILSHGAPSRYSAAALRLFAAGHDFNPRRPACHNDDGPTGINYARSCTFGASHAKPDLAVWGDSHGAELVAYLGERAGAQGRSVRELTSSACPPAMAISVDGRPYCSKINQRTLAALVKDPAIRTVVLAANSVRYNDKAELEAGLRTSVEALQAAHKQIVLVKQIPIMPYDVASNAGLLMNAGAPLDRLGMSRTTAFGQATGYDAFLDRLGHRYGLTVFDPKAALCDAAFCHAVRGGSTVMYFNPAHLSLTGVRVSFRQLANRLYAP